MIWIALHLPLLSLETFESSFLPAFAPAPAPAPTTRAENPTAPWPLGQASSSAPPLALADARVILSANAAALALGVRPGLKRATALALAPQLVLGQAAPARDAEALMAVAHVALAFSPVVVAEPPTAVRSGASTHTVLLEVRSSLRYFGGLPALHRRLEAALAPLGHRLNTVTAATPLGAALLARVHRHLDCADPAATRHALLAAPVWLLGPGREHWEALQGMGLHTIADLHAVPRDGLARRFGEQVLSELDRALGTRPDPREPVTPPPMFASRLELFARADTGEQLLQGAAVLLARLVAWLSAQHAFVRRFRFVMHHEKRSRRAVAAALAGPGVTSDLDLDTTTLEIALAEPSRDSAHLLVLLRERLAQLQLPAPTLELGLQADDIARRPPPNAELFPTPTSEHEGLTRLIERLQARLGPGQVMRLEQVADHRPERATAVRAAELGAVTSQRRPQRADKARATGSAANNRAGRKISAPGGASDAASRITSQIAAAKPMNEPAFTTPDASSHAVRPVWLLSTPQALPARQEAPCLDGQPLQLLSGPERIESGWWDAGLAERDYFIAQSPGGALVWIYRARLPSPASMPGWFLQGRFG